MGRRTDRHTLSPIQKYMYSSEKAPNFRTIAKLCATQSNYVLTTEDLVPADLIEELAQIGQFAEVANPILPTESVFKNLNILTQANFPLEGYDALLDSRLLDAWEGDVATYNSLIAYRASRRQLIVAFSGTYYFKQALYDLRFLKMKHPIGQGCRVHSGFWKIYEGVRRRALEGIQKGMKENQVQELLITGHSLGGAISSLLAFDLLTAEDIPRGLLDGVTLKMVGFGSPRAGNSRLVEVWREAIVKRRSKHGEDSVKEYLVKAYRDGVPSLPPARLGYRHFTERPLYFYHGRLFYVPVSENEHGSFAVAQDALDATRVPQYPRGGHNYYNNRDMEWIARRMQWIEEMMAKDSDWESSYRDRLSKYEKKLAKKFGTESRNLSQSGSVGGQRESVVGASKDHV